MSGIWVRYTDEAKPKRMLKVLAGQATTLAINRPMPTREWTDQCVTVGGHTFVVPVWRDGDTIRWDNPQLTYGSHRAPVKTRRRRSA